MSEDPPTLRDITPIREPDPATIAELEKLLASAEAGELRGLAFVAFYDGTNFYRYGHSGSYSLPEYAMALKLLELEFDSLVTRDQDED